MNYNLTTLKVLGTKDVVSDENNQAVELVFGAYDKEIGLCIATPSNDFYYPPPTNDPALISLWTIRMFSAVNLLTAKDIEQMAWDDDWPTLEDIHNAVNEGSPAAFKKLKPFFHDNGALEAIAANSYPNEAQELEALIAEYAKDSPVENVPTFEKVMEFNALLPRLSREYQRGNISLDDIKEFLPED